MDWSEHNTGFYWSGSMKELLHFLSCVSNREHSLSEVCLSGGRATGDHSRLQDVMGTWLIGTSRVSRQGVEIIRSFDTILRCLKWCMDQRSARGQEINYQEVLKVGGME